jgi:hypothetical protein
LVRAASAQQRFADGSSSCRPSWVSLDLFSVSLPGLRMEPALAARATIVAGLTERELVVTGARNCGPR